MASRILSIEIGPVITRVVEMDYKAKKPKVYDCFTVETPLYMNDDGVVEDNQIFLEKIRQQIEFSEIKANKVVFVINSTRVANREVDIPLVKEKQIASMIEANAAEYFPVDLKEYKLVHTVLDKVESGEDKHYRVSILAIPTDILRSYMVLAEDLHLQVEGFDYIGNSLLEIGKKYFKEDVNALLKVEAQTSVITLIKEGKTELMRTIPYGIADAVDELMKSAAYGEIDGYGEAIELFARKTLIRRIMNAEEDYKEEEDSTAEFKKVREDITESLRPLVANLSRVIQFYTSNHSEEKIGVIHIVGTGSDMSGLSKLLSNELNYKVTVLPKLESMSMTPDAGKDNFGIARYVACYGAAFAPILQKAALTENDGAHKKEKNDSLKLAIGVCAFCVAASVIMVGYGLGTHFLLQKTNDELTSEKIELLPAQDVYDAYVKKKADYDEISAMYGLTKNPNEELMSFIQELEAKMPSSINVLSMTADGTTVNMTITVADKKAAAKTLVELRTFASLKDVSTTGITEDTEETGSKVVNMTVTGTYAMPAGNAQTDSEEGATASSTTTSNETQKSGSTN